MVVALIALVLALTAPAWSASVKKLITGKQIAKNAITSPKVKDHSLLAKDFKAGQLPKGDTGLQGPKGDKGDRGATGAPGPTVTGGAAADHNGVGGIGGTLVDLNAGQTHSGQVVLPWPGRIFANGYAEVIAPSATATRASCNLFISDGTGPNTGLTAFSPGAFGDTTANGEHRSVPLAGYVDKPAGTYNIAIQCSGVGSAPNAYGAAFNYIATPTG
jgi:hypothetical protein